MLYKEWTLVRATVHVSVRTLPCVSAYFFVMDYFIYGSGGSICDISRRRGHSHDRNRTTVQSPFGVCIRTRPTRVFHIDAIWEAAMSAR